MSARGAARAHHGLAKTCQATGQIEQAHQHWQHTLDIYTDLGVPEAGRMGNDPTQSRTGTSPVISRPHDGYTRPVLCNFS